VCKKEQFVVIDDVRQFHKEGRLATIPIKPREQCREEQNTAHTDKLWQSVFSESLTECTASTNGTHSFPILVKRSQKAWEYHDDLLMFGKGKAETVPKLLQLVNLRDGSGSHSHLLTGSQTRCQQLKAKLGSSTTASRNRPAASCSHPGSSAPSAHVHPWAAYQRWPHSPPQTQSFQYAWQFQLPQHIWLGGVVHWRCWAGVQMPQGRPGGHRLGALFQLPSLSNAAGVNGDAGCAFCDWVATGWALGPKP
jgi:hypothetical protein